MSKLGSWSTTAGSNNSTPPDGWPEGQAPSTVNDCAREMMASIRTVFNDAQYFDPNLTPTFVSSTTFTVAGDQTSAIHQGRRLKLFDATAGVATTIYATVLTASFTTVTTISCSVDSGALTSSLSSFAIAVLSRNNSSLPQGLNPSFSAVVADTLTASAIVADTIQATTLRSVGTLSVSGTAVAGNIAKAWIRANLQSAPAIVASFNVASISRSSTGTYKVSFTTAFSTSNYAATIAVGSGLNYTNFTTLPGSFKFSTVASVNSLTAIDVTAVLFGTFHHV